MMFQSIKSAIYRSWLKVGEVAALFAPLPPLPKPPEFVPPIDPCASWPEGLVTLSTEKGSISGKKGDFTTFVSKPIQQRFRGEKIVAVEMYKQQRLSTPSTKITSMIVGVRAQTQMGHPGTLTQFFSSNVVGNGFQLDTCEPGQQIAFTIKFMDDCDLYLSIFGKVSEHPIVEKVSS